MNTSLLGLMHSNSYESYQKSFQVWVCKPDEVYNNSLPFTQKRSGTELDGRGYWTSRARADSHFQWSLLPLPQNVCPWPRACWVFRIQPLRKESQDLRALNELLISINNNTKGSHWLNLHSLHTFIVYLIDMRNVNLVPENDRKQPSASDTGTNRYFVKELGCPL